jgi:DNA repair protein RadC
MKDADHSTEDRPRERLTRLGPHTLSDRDLLALVLGHGTSRLAAPDIAAALLTEAGGVHGFSRVSAGRLARVPGVGAAQASRVLAAVELGRRTLMRPPRVRRPLDSPDAIAQFLLPRYGAHATERFGVLLLDARHRYLRTHIVGEGAIDAVVIRPRDVFREATIAGASAIVLFHNHPSGDPSPSANDVRLTRRLIDAGELVGIDVLDHLVLADSSYCSLRHAGLV